MRCGDCYHFYRCSWLIQATADRTICDWEPSRFHPKTLDSPVPTPVATPRDTHAFHNAFQKTNPDWKGD